VCPAGLHAGASGPGAASVSAVALIQYGSTRLCAAAAAAAAITTCSNVPEKRLATRIQQPDAIAACHSEGVDPAVRMAAMGPEKLLNEPGDPEEGQAAGDDPS
jgi:hypothetical protein